MLKKKKLLQKLKKRKNFNQDLINQLKSLQYSTKYKKKRSDFIIKNDYKFITVKNKVKEILKRI